ncbi:MAG: hypothetical protein RSA29_14595 [Clostridium sp.]|uniref:hypothetical protein n=1 Tax=Clostridium sp. TaxID=1506 RepID=UPI003216DA4B
MNKKTRYLKKHYRGVKSELRDFDIDLSEESWYSFWHLHLDFDGVTDLSQKHRKIHIQYYLKMLEKIDKLSTTSQRDFQTWIHLNGNEGHNDALYFHTKNPHNDFPIIFDNIEWNIKTSTLLEGLIDLSIFNLGRIKNEEDIYSYIIQKNDLGLKVSSQ